MCQSYLSEHGLSLECTYTYYPFTLYRQVISTFFWLLYQPSCWVFETMDTMGTAIRKTVTDGETFGPVKW
jgi:hypothetical protein